MSIAAKAGFLNSNRLMFGQFANAGTAAAGNKKQIGSRFDEEPPARRSVTALVPALLKSLACVCIATVVLLALDRVLPTHLFTIVYLIPVVIAATRWGTWPAITAALAGTAAVDFFFLPPFYTFNIDDPQDAIHLLLFLFVAIVSSNLASRLRSEKEVLRQRETELQYLYEFSRRLAACFTIPDLIAAIQNYLTQTLGQQAVFFVAKADEQFETPNIGAVPREVEERVASMIANIDLPAYTIFDESTNSIWLLRAVHSGATVYGVIAVNIGAGSAAAIQTRTGQVEAILEEASLTLQRLDIGKAMDEAKLQLQAQLLKDALHGMLSHELRSPLSAIQGSASVLGTAPAIREDDRLRSLTEAITDEVQKLDGFIQNLVNAARVTANSVEPRRQWADPKDIVNAAVKPRLRRLAEHRVRIAFDHDVPLINVDSALIEESLGQLLDNAAKYSPSGSVISVVARAESGQVVLSVSDQGVGITRDEQNQLGRRSFRSQRHRGTIPGTGLGFWIASIFVRANGGAIGISSRGEGLGTTASITLPVSSEVSSLTLANE